MCICYQCDFYCEHLQQQDKENDLKNKLYSLENVQIMDQLKQHHTSLNLIWEQVRHAKNALEGLSCHDIY